MIRIAGLSAFLAFFAFSPLVYAELRVCNDTPFKASIAVGYYFAAGWTTKGWWNIESGGCVVPIGGNLNNRYYYVRAQDDAGHVWAGQNVLCTSNEAFTVTGYQSCEARGYDSSNFSQIDVQNSKSYMYQLTCEGCKVQSGFFLTYGLNDVPGGGISLDGHSFRVPVGGWIKVDYSGQNLMATVTVNADVSSLQAGLPNIIQQHTNHNDDCDYILNVHTISLSPYGHGLQVYSAGHYEDWECLEYETIFGDVDLGKHRLFEQNGDITVVLDPQTNGNSVSMAVEVTGMNADGLLGNFLNSDWFGDWIRDQIIAAVPQVIQVGEIQSMLPVELKGFPIRIIDVAFYDRGNGELGLRTTASITVSPQFAETVWDRLRQGAQ